MALVTGQHPAVAELCRALGLRPELTQSIWLSVQADDVATVTIETLVEGPQLEGVAATLRRFRFDLVETPGQV